MLPPNNMQSHMAAQAPAQAVQGFNSQLQRPMQATPLPQNPQNPYIQGMRPGGMSSTPQPNLQMQPHQQSVNAANFTDQEIAQINAIAQSKAREMPAEAQNKLMQTFTPQQRDQAKQAGMNPMFLWWRQQVMRQIVQRKNQQNTQNGPPARNMVAGMGAIQGSQTGFGRTQHMPTSQAPSNNFQESSDVNVAQIRGQQADAQKSQDAGQLVVPASNNPNLPPPMTAQQPMGGHNQMAQQQMFNNPQFTNQQNAMRAQQARNAQFQAAQANQARNMSLQGQIGGLNGSHPPQQSPAMPNLNRPMVPPGNNTPQQRPQQGGPPSVQPSPVPMESRMSQQGQMGFSNQQGPGPAQNGPNGMQMNRAALIPQSIPSSIRQKLMAMSDQEFHQWRQNVLLPHQQQVAARNNANQGTGQLQFSMQSGRPQLQQNPLQQPGQLNVTVQHQNLGPDQSQQQAPTPKPPSNLQRLFLSNPAKIAEWDQKQFPPQLRGRVPNLPERALTWGHVKHYVSNSKLPNLYLSTILSAQSQHFEFIVNQQRQQQGQAPALNGLGPVGNMANPIAASMPANGPAPTAPMIASGQQQIPPQPKMGLQPQIPANMNNINVQQPTAEDVAQARQKHGQRVAKMNDQQLRNLIWQTKVRSFQNSIAAAQQQTNFLQQQANLGPNSMPQVRPQAQPPVPQPQQTQYLPNARSQAKPPQGPAKPTQQASLGQTPQNQRGQKRPASNDDVVELPPPKAAKYNEAPNMQQSRSQPAMPKMNQDQLANLNSEERTKLRQQAMAKASANANRQQNQLNGASTGTNGQVGSSAALDLEKQRQERVRHLMREIQDNFSKNSAPKTLSPEQLAHLRTMLHDNSKVVEESFKYAMFYYGKTGDEGLTRQILQPVSCLNPDLIDFPLTPLTIAQVVLARSMDQGIKGNQCLATPEALAAAFSALRQTARMVQQKMSAFNQQNKTNQQQTSSQEARPGSQTQLNAANLQQHQNDMSMARQASLHNHKRGNSKTPSAPTATQPPFQLGASSPHGTPVYGGSSELTSDKLKMPVPKKRKTQAGSAASTPGQPTPASISSPQVSKSPDVKRVPAAELAKPVPPKNMFKCQHDDCEYKVRGFATQQELDTHNNDMHVIVDDPLAFFLTSVAEAKGLNPDGTLKHSNPTLPTSKNVQEKDAITLKTKSADATPENNVAATPMARSVTQPGQHASSLEIFQFNIENKPSTPSSNNVASKEMPNKAGAATKEANVINVEGEAQTSRIGGNDPKTSLPLEGDTSHMDSILPPELAPYDETVLYEKLMHWHRKFDREQGTKASTEITTPSDPAAKEVQEHSPPEKTPELSSPSGQDDTPESQKLDPAEEMELFGHKRKRDRYDDGRFDDYYIDYEDPQLPGNAYPADIDVLFADELAAKGLQRLEHDDDYGDDYGKFVKDIEGDKRGLTAAESKIWKSAAYKQQPSSGDDANLEAWKKSDNPFGYELAMPLMFP